MPAPINPEVPVTPWTLFPTIAEIPAKGFKGIEVEAVAIEKDQGCKVYCTRLVFSPEDGPLKMCSVYLREGAEALCASPTCRPRKRRLPTPWKSRRPAGGR